MVIVIAAVAGVLVLCAILWRTVGRRFPWFEFFIKGKESGFSLREINLLRKVAVQNRLSDPTSLFWSVKQLDASIRGVLARACEKGTEEDETTALFLAKLFEFRKRVEFALPKYRLGLKSTRSIEQHQKVKISFEGGGMYQSSVIENMRKYLALSYPQGPALPPGFVWTGKLVNVYFWRAEDAGYSFQTKVIDDFKKQSYEILHLAHTSQLVRTQKRRSHRTEAIRPAQLYVLRSLHPVSETWSDSPGLRCRIQNISENGVAVLVGGRAKPGIPIRVQFTLLDKQIVMNGIVKGVSYDHKKSQSILHVEAVAPSLRMKNTILTYVYGVFSDDLRQGLLPKVPVSK
jgi:c-di-GMP-binding flagellar brake protein YcgR